MSNETFTFRDLMELNKPKNTTTLTSAATDTGLKALIVSDEGVAYYVDLNSGQTYWSLQLPGGNLYNFFHSSKSDYINVLEEGSGINRRTRLLYYHYDGRQPEELNIDNDELMRSQLENLLKNPQINRDEIPSFSVDRLTGNIVDESNVNSFKVKRVNWSITSDDRVSVWNLPAATNLKLSSKPAATTSSLSSKPETTTSSLRFAVVTVSDPNTVVYCAYSARRFLEICYELRLQYLPGEGYLIRAYNLSRRSQIKYPEVRLASLDGNGWD